VVLGCAWRGAETQVGVECRRWHGQPCSECLGWAGVVLEREWGVAADVVYAPCADGKKKKESNYHAWRVCKLGSVFTQGSGDRKCALVIYSLFPMLR